VACHIVFGFVPLHLNQVGSRRRVLSFTEFPFPFLGVVSSFVCEVHSLVLEILG
jgi:hypothetical protein